MYVYVYMYRCMLTIHGCRYLWFSCEAYMCIVWCISVYVYCMIHIFPWFSCDAYICSLWYICIYGSAATRIYVLYDTCMYCMNDTYATHTLMSHESCRMSHVAWVMSLTYESCLMILYEWYICYTHAGVYGFDLHTALLYMYTVCTCNHAIRYVLHDSRMCSTHIQVFMDAIYKNGTKLPASEVTGDIFICIYICIHLTTRVPDYEYIRCI
jgi:hypothetical protein